MQINPLFDPAKREREYWWAREIASGEVAPVQVWKKTLAAPHDTVVIFGDDGAYEAKFWEMLEQIPIPKSVQNS